MRTAYDILAVPSEASAEEIEAAFRRRLLEAHPDRLTEGYAGPSVAELEAARSLLLDPSRRDRLDFGLRLGRYRPSGRRDLWASQVGLRAVLRELVRSRRRCQEAVQDLLNRGELRRVTEEVDRLQGGLPAGTFWPELDLLAGIACYHDGRDDEARRRLLGVARGCSRQPAATAHRFLRRLDALPDPAPGEASPPLLPERT